MSNSIPSETTEFDISGLEAMLAGTLCLMSAYSHCHGHGGKDDTHQGLIGLKIVSNLTCLQYQNSLSPEFRRVLGKVCDAWRQNSLGKAADQPHASVAPTQPLWHRAPDAMQ